MDSLKVVLLGNSGVGKTSIVQRFVFEKFKEVNPATLGAMFMAKSIEIPQSNLSIRFNLWDTAGQEKYHSLAATYYKDAAIALIVYDITNLSTFEGAKTWINELREKSTQETMLILVGNKSDMVDKEVVDPKLAKTYAEEMNMDFRLVSAKDGMGVKDMLVDAAKQLLSRNHTKKEQDNEKKRLDNKSNKKKNGCC